MLNLWNDKMIKIILAFILGFGVGVWFQYLNVLFWRNKAKRDSIKS